MFMCAYGPILYNKSPLIFLFMSEPSQREFREGPVRYNMGRGGPRPVYDRERTDRGGLRRRDGADKMSRFREYHRPRSPK